MHEFSLAADLPKAQRYAELLPQIRAMLDPEPELLNARFRQCVCGAERTV